MIGSCFSCSPPRWCCWPPAQRSGRRRRRLPECGRAGRRWSLIGVLPGLGAAAVLQLLHALSFGASHLGAMHFLARNVPPYAAASAQSLYSALSAGLGSGVVMLAAGWLYAAYGGQAYPFM